MAAGVPDAALICEIQTSAVQTTPGLASPVDPQSGLVCHQCRSVQTSPGVSTPAEGAAGCGQCQMCQYGVCTCPRIDAGGQDTAPSAPSAPTCLESDSSAQCVLTCDQSGVCFLSSQVKSQSSSGAADPSEALITDPATPLPSPADAPSAGSPDGGGGGGSVWTVPASDRPPSAPPAPPARLLAYGQPSWVGRQQSAEQAAELRRRLDSGQRAAGRRRDSVLRRRADRAAELAAPAGQRSSGGDHDRADLPDRPAWR